PSSPTSRRSRVRYDGLQRRWSLAFGLGQLAPLDVADGGRRFPGGDAEGQRGFDFGADRELAVFQRLIDDLLLVDPGRDLGLRHGDADRIPAVVVERLVSGSVVRRGVFAVDRREADHAASPAADDETTGQVADGKR